MKTGGDALSPSSSSGGSWAHAELADEFTGPCTIPVHTDEYSGFTIGHPKGWSLDYGNGTIEVDKDESGMVGALVYPARLRQRDIPADKLADMFATQLGRSIEQAGGTFSLANKKTDGHVAQADASATVSGVNLHGPLQVVSEKGFATVKLYWAPETRFEAEEPELKQVVTCFKRQMLVVQSQPKEAPAGRSTSIGKKPTATAAAGAPGKAAPAGHVGALKPFQSKFFVGQVPDAWKVADENANGIDLVSGDGLMSVGFGWVLNPVQGPQQMVMDSLHRFRPNAKIVSSGPSPAPPGQVAYAVEWETPQAHGYEQSTRGPNIIVTTSIIAANAKWDANHDTLAASARTIQITPGAVSQVQANVRAFIATLPKATPSAATSTSSSSSSSSSSVMSQWETQDKTNQEFDDAIRGNDRVTSPTTGTEYTVPYNAWSSTGPQGAGYYRALPGGGTERLNMPGE